MHIHYRKMRQLPVYTESGVGLGHVKDLEIDLETHQIRKYIVSGMPIIKTRQKYYIAPEQIVSITDEKIVVADNSVKITDRAAAAVVLAQAKESFALSSKLSLEK